MPISPLQFQEMESRIAAGKRKRRSDSWEQEKADHEQAVADAKRETADTCVEEAKLHAQIIAECERRRWAFVHNRMDKKSTATRGAPDFVIFGRWEKQPGIPRVWIIECKSKTGKLSTDQNEWRCIAIMNGHIVHVVRSFGEFLEVVNPGSISHADPGPK